MTWFNSKIGAMPVVTRLAAGAALVAIGVAGGASGASLRRPAIEMAPTIVTPIAKLPDAGSIVTIKGRVSEVYGDRVVIADASGKTMIDIGPDTGSSLAVGSQIAVQGRYEDGQLHGSFLIGPGETVTAIGPDPRHVHGPRPRGHGGPAPSGPELAPPSPDAAPLPADCAALKPAQAGPPAQ